MYIARPGQWGWRDNDLGTSKDKTGNSRDQRDDVNEAEALDTQR